MVSIREILKLIRPKQWAKNLFVFLPLFFDKKILELDYLLPALVLFFSFCFASSGVYCFNDIHDVEADRKHPKKCRRPIASGAICKPLGMGIMAACFFISVGLMSLGFLGRPWGWRWIVSCVIIICYVLMNIAYCVRLKLIAIVDVFIISIGFVLRIAVGGLSTGIFLSHWIVLMTFLLALFLAFAKRRDDVVLYEKTGEIMRNNIVRYNLTFINQVMGIIGGMTIVCYLMWSVSPEIIERLGSSYLYVTSIFVIAGIIRYLQITIVDVRSGSPTAILYKDRFIHACLAGWGLLFIFIIYVLK